MKLFSPLPVTISAPCIGILDETVRGILDLARAFRD